MAELILIDIAKHFQVGNGTRLGCRSIKADSVCELDFKMFGSNFETMSAMETIDRQKFRILVAGLYNSQ